MLTKKEIMKELENGRTMGEIMVEETKDSFKEAEKTRQNMVDEFDRETEKQLAELDEERKQSDIEQAKQMLDMGLEEAAEMILKPWNINIEDIF